MADIDPIPLSPIDIIDQDFGALTYNVGAAHTVTRPDLVRLDPGTGEPSEVATLRQSPAPRPVSLTLAPSSSRPIQT
jgi:hypothetical protein